MPKHKIFLSGVGLLVVLAFLLVAKATPEAQAAGCKPGECGVTPGSTVSIGSGLTSRLNSVTNALSGATGSATSAGQASSLDGYKIISNPDTCSVCKNGAAAIDKLSKDNGIPISPQGASQNREGLPNLQDPQGNPVAAGIDNIGKSIEDIKNKAKNAPKPNTDKCILIRPGISATLRTMYGEEGVKAENDKHQFCDDVIKDTRCTLGTDTSCNVPVRLYSAIKASAEIKETYPLTFKITKDIPDKTCVWATDWAGRPAYSNKGSGGGGVENHDNFRMRDKQNKDSANKFQVTFRSDLKLMAGTGADLVEINTQGPTPSTKTMFKSNEQIAEEAAGGNLVPGQPYRPNKDQHLQWIDSNTYTAPGGKVMFPGEPYPAGEKALSAAAKIALRGGTAGAEAGNQDVKVTEQCTYENNTDQAPTKPNAQSPWSPSGNNPGNSGSPGGDQGGLLGKILPALMQALQGLGQGGGQQPQQSGGQQGGEQPQQGGKQGGQQGQQGTSTSPSPSPYAYPSDYECPASATDTQVCGVDGATYGSRCIAEYQNQVAVKHTGICTDAEEASADSSLGLASQILAEVTNSGIPQNLISTVINIVTNVITQMFAVGDTDLPQPTATT
jgi:hypothetical protein